MKKLILTALVAGLTGSMVGAGIVFAQAPGAFNQKDIRFDESMGNKKPLPQVPKSWQFVSVVQGGKTNVNNLYFRDKEGNIQIIQIAFSDYNTWALEKNFTLKVDAAQ